MISFLHGGIKYIQTRHAIYCKLCKDTVESNFIHDFKMCSCNSVGVDGGIVTGNSIIGLPENMEPRSIYCANINGRLVFLPQYIIQDAHLNKIEKYKQNAREIKGRETKRNNYTFKKVT